MHDFGLNEIRSRKFPSSCSKMEPTTADTFVVDEQEPSSSLVSDGEEEQYSSGEEEQGLSAEDEELSSLDSDNVLAGWTKYSKFMLLQALKLYGSHDLDLILMTLPHKTKEEIEAAITYYKSRIIAGSTTDKKKKKKKKINAVSIAPLGVWVQILTDKLKFNELHTETATALRLIANYESFPPSELCEGIDFALVYHLLANALEGKSFLEVGLMAPIMEKCLIETALTSKAFIRRTTFQTIIEQINVSDKEINSFPRPTANDELAAIRHLASQRAYNPFKIDETYLKQSVFNEVDDL